MACLIIGTPRARALPDRRALAAFFARLKGAGSRGGGGGGGGSAGAFAVTADGESDTRGTYTVLAAASALGVLTPALRAGCAAFLAACQGAEGGFGGEPGNEAHGGYTYCALAALDILRRSEGGGGGLAAQGVDAAALQHWLARRQMASEGGFSGRCNKLVDACYSFWLGASCVLAARGSSGGGGGGLSAAPAAPAPAPGPAQLYILAAAQLPGGRGGCRDKPGKAPDFYHTCYALAGLSVAVWEGGGGGGGGRGEEVKAALQGRLFPTDCVYNVRPERLLL